MFLPKNKYLPERKKSSCKKLYQLHVRNATILKNFTATAKISLVIKNINAVFVNINLHRHLLRNISLANTHPALLVARLLSCTTTTPITQIIVVVTRSVIIRFLLLNQLLNCPPSMSKLVGKEDFKRLRHPVQLVITALTQFYIGKSSFRNIALMLRMLYNIKISHVTISDWCKKFAPLFNNISLSLLPSMNFNSDEWHTDETVVKIKGKKYYIWFIVDSETRFVLGFHLSPYRDSPQAFSLLNSVKSLGKPKAIVSDRYSAYKVPIKALYDVKHIRVESFKDDVSNNLIEAFHKQFKAWYKTKQGFNSFDGANNMIAMFVFFYNYIRPHSALNGLTPAQVAGCKYSAKQQNSLLLVS